MTQWWFVVVIVAVDGISEILRAPFPYPSFLERGIEPIVTIYGVPRSWKNGSVVIAGSVI